MLSHLSLSELKRSELSSFCVIRSAKLAAIGDDDRGLGGARLGSDALNLLDNVHATGDGAEDGVLAIEPVGLDGAEEELRSVGVGPRVGHREDPRSSVLEREVLIGELHSVDGLTTGAVAADEVAALAHELADDTVEGRALQRKWRQIRFETEFEREERVQWRYT